MKNYTYGFEKLEVWTIAKEITVTVYNLTGNFPDEEKFGLTNQMRRASISICSNIAESTGRLGKKDKLRFIEYAYSSALELLSQVLIAVELKFCLPEDVAELRDKIEKQTNKLNGLRRSFTN